MTSLGLGILMLPPLLEHAAYCKAVLTFVALSCLSDLSGNSSVLSTFYTMHVNSVDFPCIRC